MRISDWSSDVCSSDLERLEARRPALAWCLPLLLNERVALDLVHADLVLLLVDAALVVVLLDLASLVVEVKLVAACRAAGAYRAAQQGLAAGHQKHRCKQRRRCNLGRGPGHGGPGHGRLPLSRLFFSPPTRRARSGSTPPFGKLVPSADTDPARPSGLGILRPVCLTGHYTCPAADGPTPRPLSMCSTAA